MKADKAKVDQQFTCFPVGHFKGNKLVMNEPEKESGAQGRLYFES